MKTIAKENTIAFTLHLFHTKTLPYCFHMKRYGVNGASVHVAKIRKF